MAMITGGDDGNSESGCNDGDDRIYLLYHDSDDDDIDDDCIGNRDVEGNNDSDSDTDYCNVSDDSADDYDGDA